MKLTNWDEHKIALTALDKLIAEGFEGDAQREAQFSELATAIEAFEDSVPLMLPLSAVTGYSALTVRS